MPRPVAIVGAETLRMKIRGHRYGTPAPIVNRLNAEIGKALAMADGRERFASLGYEAAGSTPEQFAAVIAADVAKFAKIIKDANIRAD